MDWESEVFWAMHMTHWRWMGGFREFTTWGSVDMDFVARRHTLGIQTIVAKSLTTPHKGGVLMVYHQDHDSKRDMDAAIKSLQGATYGSPLAARQAGGLYPIYLHGPRERGENGSLVSILGDHKSRYEWAANYTQDKNILDIPCGTGYGARLLGGFCFYTGIDIDSESILHAQSWYKSPSCSFQQGDMRQIPGGDNHYDLVVCFEGIEHISREDKARFVSELYRVLRPGGTFIISTPQKGATAGTPWDIDMLTQGELYGLFDNPGWTRLDWFYQTNYGAEQVPTRGIPPENAEIMILGGTVVK